MVWRASDPTGGEAIKMKYELVPYTRGRGLDLGCGNHKAFPHFIGVDSNIDSQIFKINCRPDILLECTDLAMFGSGSMDFIFSSHLLEHIPFDEVDSTLKEWWRVIKKGGHLCLYLPDEDEYPKVGEKGANPDHKWNVNYDKIVNSMKKVGSWDLVEFQKRNQGREYSLFFVFRKM